ncbi:MAG: c-type cytochrome [Usitatibacter sp.]
MRRFIDLAVAGLLASVPAYAGTTAFPGAGRLATPAEIAAWDIDVRPDFKGLPPGSGSVKDGQRLWDAKCAGCHGTFGESNEVFTPLVGGTTADDIRTGRVKALVTGDVARTTFMKLSTISTLWDYIRRAMPWNAPKSLSTDDVYAAVAYLLNLADIVPDDFVLTNANIAEVQARLPNRNGMTRDHGLWDVRGRPDVANVACMKDCPTQARLASIFPEAAKDAFGDLGTQNRTVGPTRSVHAAAQPVAAKPAPASDELARRSGCLACHDVDKRAVGPSFRDVAARYRGAEMESKLVEKVHRGGSGAWGPVAMPPNAALAPDDARALVRWVLGL